MHKTTVFLCVYLFVEHLLYSEALDLDTTPRRTINYQDATLKILGGKGMSNFSSLLLSEEHRLLIVGARDAILALDIEDVSKIISHEKWEALKEKRNSCVEKGKSEFKDCHNYIVGLHRVTENKIYVCGTHAFYPMCDYMYVDNGKIELERQPHHNNRNTPYDPEYSFASNMVNGELYSATQSNFLGTEWIFQRSLKKSTLRTEYFESWLKDPKFVFVDVVRENEDNPEGEDDKIYLFFSEIAMEFNFKSEILTSRVARVCKGDQGGSRILLKKWCTFLKAGLECKSPHLDVAFNVIQDVYLLKAHKRKDNIFYAVFTMQWGLQNNSAVCAFTMEAIDKILNEGAFKTIEVYPNGKYQMIKHTGAIPVPRPGICINNNLIEKGYSSSLDIPDKTLVFIQKHPFLHDVVMPKDNHPLLVKQATVYTQIVVHKITALNKKQYDVMFLGTDKGYLHKALNIAGKGFIIEEIQIFSSEEPVKILKISPTREQLYVSSQSQVIQVPVAVCSQYKTCWDCVLARDTVLGICCQNNASALQTKTAQKVWLRYQLIVPRQSMWLTCNALNLAQKEWLLNGEMLQADPSKYVHMKQALLILNLSGDDKGQYDCQVTEMANGKKFTRILESYALWVPEKKYHPSPKLCCV